MRWGEGDNWSLDLDMPGGSYDFKFVVQSDITAAEASEWEAGANRFLFVSPSVFMPTTIFTCFVVSPVPTKLPREPCLACDHLLLDMPLCHQEVAAEVFKWCR